MSENDEVPQSIAVIRDERGIAFLGEPASIKQWLDERGMTSREFKVKAAKVASSAIQATNKSAMIEARDDRLRKVQNRAGDLQSVFEQTADRVRGEKLLHPFTVDKVLSQLNDLTSQTYAFSKHLDIEIERKPIERAPEWGGRLPGSSSETLPTEPPKALSSLEGPLPKVPERWEMLLVRVRWTWARQLPTERRSWERLSGALTLARWLRRFRSSSHLENSR